MAEKWIQKAITHPGALREYFGIKEGETIPEGRLNALIRRLQEIENKTAKESSLLKQALLARTLKRMPRRGEED